MEKQIRENMQRAFWDLLEEDLKQDPPNTTHLKKLLSEIIGILCSFVPSRSDIHKLMRDELDGEITWNFQGKLLDWISKFQPPVYDEEINKWKRECPQPISKFLPRYYDHIDRVSKDINKYRQRLESGKPLVDPPDVSGSNGVPDNMKSGR